MKQILYRVFTVFQECLETLCVPVLRVLMSWRLQPRKSKSVCVIRTDALGDMVLTMDLLQSLEATFGKENCVLVCTDEAADLLRTVGFPWTMISCDSRDLLLKPWKRWAFYFKLWRFSFGIVVVPVRTPENRLSYWLARSARTFVRWAVRSGVDGKGVSETYERELQVGPWIHETQAYQILALRLGLVWSEFDWKNCVPPTTASIGQYLLVHCGSRDTRKLMTADQIADIINQIGSETDLYAVLCGSESDRARGDAIRTKLRVSATDRVGQTNFSELIRMISRARLVLAFDSVVAHLAAHLQVPTIAVVGGGHWGRFFPYPEGFSNLQVVASPRACFRCAWNCPYLKVGAHDPKFPCVSEIVSADIFRASQAVLVGTSATLG